MRIENKLLILIFSIFISGNLYAVGFTVSASSELKETVGGKEIIYSASNLSDNDLSTVWVEGTEGFGDGEWIEYSFAEKTYIGKLLLANGYQKREDLFYKNNRVLEISVILDGNDQRTYFLYDTNMWNVCVIDSEVKTLKIVIQDFYHGALYDDTCISEIRFDYAKLRDDYLSLYKKELSTIPDIEKKETALLNYYYGKTTHEQIEDFGRRYEEIEKLIMSDENYSREVAIYGGSLQYFLLNSSSKEAWEGYFAAFPEARVVCSEFITHRSIIFEIANQVKLNEVMENIPYYQLNLEGRYIVEDPIFSDLEKNIYKRITGDDVYDLDNNVWPVEDFYLKDTDKSYPFLQLEKLIYLDTDTENQRWDATLSSLYIESFEVIENSIDTGQLNISMDNYLEMNIDISSLKAGDIIYVGLFTADFTFSMKNADDVSGLLVLKPVYGFNWHDEHDFDNFQPFEWLR